MPKVTVLTPFEYKGKSLLQHDEINMPEHAIRLYEKIDFVERTKAEDKPKAATKAATKSAGK